MNKAIITGAAGLVGEAVAKYLSSMGVQILCLGRECLEAKQIAQKFGPSAVYLVMPMNEIGSLRSEARKLGWELGGNSVFYNFAWAGLKGLTDGEFNDQLTNAIFAAEAVKAAKEIGCFKFVDSGSMEETFIEEVLNRGRIESYSSSQTFYGLAKLAARDMCAMVSYLEGIDYVHTRMSVPLASGLSNNSYISLTLKKILGGEKHEPPTSQALYDFVLLDDVARAYYLIGMKGYNKANYFIGTGRPATLRQHFENFSQFNKCNKLGLARQIDEPMSHFFDVQPLKQDVNFIACHDFDTIISHLRQP